MRCRSRLLATVLFVFMHLLPCTAVRANTPVPAESSGYRPGPMLQQMLDGPMRDIDEIVFAVRVPGRDHWYVTFGNYADHGQYAKDLGYKFEEGVYWGYAEGGRLCRLNLRTGKLNVLLDDPAGGVRDPQLHYDGQKILFSYRRGGSHVFHLYEINIDGSGLRQLTDGPDDDIEPTYCPDGSIVFCSARCRRFVNCWYTRVAALYRCDADGGNIRMLSSNNDHDNTPWTLPDGRVLYMRWEYVDRSQVHYHHLWTANPDGTGQMVFYGNMHPGIAMLDAKPIPGSNKIVASFSPGHGRPEHRGWVSVVDPRRGPDHQPSAQNISERADWKDPYALSEDCFLVAHQKGLFVMNGSGQTELIYELPEDERAKFECHEPRALRGRQREKVIAPRVELGRRHGQLILQDIYHGRNMEGVERGSIKRLLIMKQLPKPVNFSGGMEPLTIGGSFTLAELVGTVPVEPDGSAYFDVPALQSVFFVALDEQDRPVKRMHSFATVQPGETTACVGCHEARLQAPHVVPDNLMALRRPPSPVEPIADVPPVIDFPRDIQPILDRHCVECHNADRLEGGADFTGDRTRQYTMSYWEIRNRNLVIDARNQPQGNYAPYSYGSVASRLMQLMDGGHHDVRVSDAERKLVRLWIETSATYPGTYAALGSGVYHAHLPVHDMNQRCGGCHMQDFTDNRGKQHQRLTFRGGTSHGWQTLVNLDRPEKSRVLRAPLAKDAGGMGRCKEPVFASTDDPLYKKMLAGAQDAHRRLMEGKRFDMSGFRPNEHYIREMQRFGFLSPDLAADDPVDIYATDRAYWDSFLHQPMH
ncbi:MAG: hypothetical protein U1E05_05945 [Patescibacteria group bacterium]|nr:hypothetical protein [Patescibacteria group bacterium]